MDTARVAAAAHRWTGVYALQLMTGVLWSPSYDGVPVDGVCESEPTRLVERVTTLLSTNAEQALGMGKTLKFPVDRDRAS